MRAMVLLHPPMAPPKKIKSARLLLLLVVILAPTATTRRVGVEKNKTNPVPVSDPLDYQKADQEVNELCSQARSSWASQYTSLEESLWGHGTSTVYGTNSLELLTDIYEVWETVGPGTVYTDCEGFTHSRRTGAPTATITKKVSVTNSFLVNYTNFPDFPASNGTSRWDEFASLVPERPSCVMLPPGAARCSSEDLILLDDSMESKNTTNRTDKECRAFTRCRASLGREVALLYWQEEAPSNRAQCSSITSLARRSQTSPPRTLRTAVLKEITFSGQDVYFRGSVRTYHSKGSVWSTETLFPANYLTAFVFSGPFTFTSPTVYVAYRDLEISATHTVRGLSMTNGMIGEDETAYRLPAHVTSPAGVLTLQSEDISSLQFLVGGTTLNLANARKIAMGRLNEAGISTELHHVFDDMDPNPEERYEILYNPDQIKNTWVYEPEHFESLYDWERPAQTVQANFGDFRYPIPATAYYNGRFDCLGKQTHCATISDDSFRPRLRVNNKFWRSHGLDSVESCNVLNIPDPPISLVPLNEREAELGPPPTPSQYLGIVTPPASNPGYHGAGHNYPAPGQSASMASPIPTGGELPSKPDSLVPSTNFGEHGRDPGDSRPGHGQGLKSPSKFIPAGAARKGDRTGPPAEGDRESIMNKGWNGKHKGGGNKLGWILGKGGSRQNKLEKGGKRGEDGDIPGMGQGGPVIQSSGVTRQTPRGSAFTAAVTLSGVLWTMLSWDS